MVDLGKGPLGHSRRTVIEMPLAKGITGRPRSVALTVRVSGPQAGPFHLTGTVRWPRR